MLFARNRCRTHARGCGGAYTRARSTVGRADARVWELKRAAKPFADPLHTPALFMSWTVYQFEVDGRPIVEWFLDAKTRRLSSKARTWLYAQREAWLSMWEVIDVVPGSRITLKDLLTGEQRTIVEKSASEQLVHRDVILGRITNYEQLSLLCGVHPHRLPTMHAAAVVDKVRRRLRRKTAVPVERLRPDKIGRYMIKHWEAAVEDFTVSRSTPPQLHNTDGDELLLTVDHYTIQPGGRKSVEQALANLDGAVPPERGQKECVYTFLREGDDDWQSTVVGRARLHKQTLRLETNSVARANALRKVVEAASRTWIAHTVREHADPVSGHGVQASPVIQAPNDDANQLIREFKDKHYANWLDHPVSALRGKTPRQAAQTKTGRKQVELLLKDMENREAQVPAEQRFDHSQLRQQLGLDARS